MLRAQTKGFWTPEGIKAPEPGCEAPQGHENQAWLFKDEELWLYKKVGGDILRGKTYVMMHVTRWLVNQA